MSAETPAAASLFDRLRLQFRAWRGTRPFWAGLFVMLAGIPIMYFPYAHLTIGQLTVRMSTTAGAGSLIIGALLVVLGISLWFQKHVRTFAGTAAILLGLVSLPVSNFGGFVVGFLLALVGGALAIAWAPGEPEPDTKIRSACGQRRHGCGPRSGVRRGPGACRGRRWSGPGGGARRTGHEQVERAVRAERSVRNEPGERGEREAQCRLTR